MKQTTKNTIMRIATIIATAVMTAACGTVGASAANVRMTRTAKTATRKNNSTSQSIELTDADAVAGKVVNVDLNLFADDACSGYTLSVEFDEALEFRRVNGGAVFNQEDNLVHITGFTPYTFEDGKVGSMTFVVPEDALANETYEIRIMKVKNFGNLEGEFTDYTVEHAEINIIETDQKKGNFMAFESKVGGDTEVQIGLRGDVNGDGKVDVFDAVALAQATMGKNDITEASRFFGNVNNDDSFDVFDAVSIARYSIISGQSGAWATVLQN